MPIGVVSVFPINSSGSSALGHSRGLCRHRRTGLNGNSQALYVNHQWRLNSEHVTAVRDSRRSPLPPHTLRNAGRNSAPMALSTSFMATLRVRTREASPSSEVRA
jgi:hypothetical protein